MNEPRSTNPALVPTESNASPLGNLPPLNTDDVALLARLERQLASGKTPSVTVANAVAIIKRKGLARLHQLTFPEYCSQRLRLKKSRVHQLLEFAELLEVTASSGSLSLAGNERQLRPLKRLPRAAWADTWADAVRTAPAGRVTGRHVDSVVEARLAQMRAVHPHPPVSPEPHQPPAQADTPPPVPTALDAATSAPSTTTPPVAGASKFIRTVPAAGVTMPGWKEAWQKIVRDASRPPASLRSGVYGWQPAD